MYYSRDPRFREAGSGQVRIATLGDEPTGSTCSIAAVKAHYGADLGEVAGYETFEEAAEALVRGDSELTVVPAAYPGIHRMFFDTRIRADSTYLHPLPDIVLASTYSSCPEDLNRIYHHPATASLASSVDPRAERVEVTSNTRARAQLLKHPHSEGIAAAVTNQLAASAYELTTHRVLVPGEVMAFVAFTRAARGTEE